MNSLLQAYSNVNLAYSLPFKDYVRELLQSGSGKDFWIKSFENITVEPLPIIKKSINSVPVYDKLEGSMKLDPKAVEGIQKQHGITMGTILRTAWSLSLRSYYSGDSVIFGTVVSGRDKPLDGIER